MTEYFFWRMADYFTEYLMGDKTMRPVDIDEMNREIEQSGNKGAAAGSAFGRRGPEEEDY
jgi:hypothetical protein